MDDTGRFTFIQNRWDSIAVDPLSYSLVELLEHSDSLGEDWAKKCELIYTEQEIEARKQQFVKVF